MASFKHNGCHNRIDISDEVNIEASEAVTLPESSLCNGHVLVDKMTAATSPLTNHCQAEIAHVCLEVNPDEDKRFFTEMLADIDDPTLPFDLCSIRAHKTEFDKAHLKVPQALTDQLRTQAKQLQIRLTSLCHLAFAQVLARTSKREKVVFGTVLFGRFQNADDNGTAMKSINILPLCVNMNDISVMDAVHQIHGRLNDLYAHKFASLAMAQRCSKLPSEVPLFSAILNYVNNEYDDGIATPLPGMTILNFEERTSYPLTLTIDDYNDSNELRLTVKVDSPISATRICRYMEQTLKSLADALQHTPQQSVRTITVMPPEERHLLLHTFNQTAAPYPTDRCLHQLFEDQVINNGNKIAVQCEGETLSYAELNTQANRLAHYLIQIGVKPESRVGLCMTRNTALVAAMLGILKSGGAYVPLDPAYPKQRLMDILQDAEPICIVTDSVGQNALGTQQVPMVDMEQALPIKLSDDNPDSTTLGLKSNHVAYVIYTSGSTGKPKGVMIEHRNATNLIYWAIDAYDTKDLEHMLFSTSVNFDMSIFQTFVPLALGYPTYIVPDAISLAGVPSTISMMETVPSVVTALLNSNNLPSSLRAVNLGGEPLSKRLIENIFAKTQISKLCNMYAPTETTTYSTCYKYEPGDVIVETLGKPIANTWIYILDSQRELVPLGAEGEMYIGGAGVTRGYLNRPDLTAERFLADPFCDKPGARMYRTGDRARYLPDGNIITLGRTDQQVKVRGYRIELSEIEKCLVNHPRVREAVVQPKSDGSDTRLIAYVVADPDELLARDLRTYVSSMLPSYMVSAAFVTLSALPMTSTCKIDRLALPVPDSTAFVCKSYEAPKGEMEEKLAVIWRDLLDIERISRHDNFFELGGHSLLVVRLLAQLRQDGLDTSVRTIFDSLSLATLAANIFRHQVIIAPPNLITTDSTKITPEMLPLIKLSQAEIDIIVAQVPGGIANIQDIYGLAPLQQGILYHYMVADRGDPYLLVSSFRFTDRATLERYANALQHVVERHDVFRTSFIWRDLSEPAQVVWRHVPLILTEISIEDGGRPILEQLNSRFNSHNYRFDLTQAPLLRLIAAPTNDGGWVALQLLHHIICDHFTLDRLNIEVHDIVDGSSNNLLTPTPFRHTVTRVRLQANPDEDKRYFSEMFADVYAPTIPFGLHDVSGADAVLNESHLRLPQALTDQLRAEARRLQISLASLCHLAWAQVLAQSTGLKSVVFGTVITNRFQAADGNDSAMGLLINTLPLRLNIDDTTVEATVRNVHDQLVELFNHEYASLAMAQRCSKLPSEVPLFSALLNYVHNEHDGIATSLPGMTILKFEERTNYPLYLTIDYDNDSHTLELTANVDSPISASRICGYMEQALTSLADALQHTPQQSVRTMTVLPPEERHLLLNTFNQTAATYPTDRCLHQLFEDQVTNNGNKIAVQCEGETLSYAELNAQANRLAHYLIQLGVKPDSRVCLCMARNTALVVGILGIFKSGGAYVPLDPVYPQQRLIDILQDAEPICIVTDSTGQNALGTHPVPMVDMEQALPINLSDDNPGVRSIGLKSKHLAYVIYTSGSTGKPKGVMVEHRNVTNCIYFTKDTLDTKDIEHALVSSSVSFDMSIIECFTPLSAGKTIYIVPDAISLASIPSTKSMINTVPSAVTTLLNTNNLPSSLHAACLGGEPSSEKLIENIFAKTKISKLWNLYGPTETTVYATWHKYEPGDVIVETIGRPVANSRIYLLDSQRELVPLGAEGEIYIGGAGVARGYLNRPDLTAELFLADPFCDKPGARMYRTGDRARYLPDGNIIYLGRTDEQVKIRGYRIEPGEIEARLVNHPKVREAVVQPRSDGYDTRLIAYVVADPDELLARDLRTYLSSLLPSYMVPSAFVTLSALPVAPNGKLDRRALPFPDDTTFASPLYEAPKGESEEKMAVIWRDLLGIERISRHDNFFELGGHSLLVVRLLAQLRQDGLDTSVRTIFDSPSLATLAANIFRHQAIIIPPNQITTESTKITTEMLPLIKLSQTEIDIIIERVPGGQSNIQDIYGLAPLQHGILYHYMMAEKGDPYLTSRRIHFTDRTTLELYVNALQHVIERHDILRTAFVWEGLNEPAQVVWRKAPPFFIEYTLDHRDEEALEQLSRYFNPKHYKLDLSEAPLLRLIAAPTADGGWVAIQLMHHIIGDNFTVERIHSEVRVIIDECREHLEKPTPFRHIVAQTRLGADPEEDKRFFSEMLADIDEPTFPFGLSDIRGNTTDFNTADLQLSQLLNNQLRAQAKRLQISLASLCHLAWAQVLARSSGRESVVFGTVLLGRFQATEGNNTAMGLLINTLPLRINIDDTTVTASVRQAHARVSELLSHEHASLALAQRCSGVPANMPLFSSLLNYRRIQQGGMTETSLPGMTFLSSEDRTNYPLVLWIEDNGDDALRLRVDVSSSVSAARICGYMEQTLKSLVDALQHTPQKSVRTITVLPPEERHLLLHTFNQTAATYPSDRCLHQLFENQVINNGNKIAVQCEGETLSYAELNTQANRLAHYLIQIGVKPESRVGLCMTRNTALVAAMLGILKSGGAYVPLDPAYPKQRLMDILQDAEPICIVTDSVGQNALGTQQVPMVDMEQALPIKLSDDNPDITRLGLKSNHVAYIIYTSGSTGKPKGVMIEHRNATNLIYWAIDAYDTKDLEHMLFSTSVNFDMSIFQTFVPLALGYPTYIVPDAISLAGVPSTISMMETVPSVVTALLNSNNLPSSLRVVNLGGESLSKRLIENIFAKTQISKLCNMYAPTETTTYSTCYKYEPGDVIVETLGKPIANTWIYILDSQRELVPLGAEGEMYIGGAGVTRGYLNRPDLTAERFVADPFSDKPGARMYRTGDRARYLPDGNIITLGRTDQQVKVRGYRIELSEIEKCLVNHPRVREAVVQPKSDGSDTRLIAYVVADPDELLARDLRTYVSSMLPSYMVPAAFVTLSALPMTSTCKIDRLALPAPDCTAFVCKSYEAPEGDVEEKLAVIWRDLLGIERISRHDNFFELGGHSLLVVRLLAQLRQDGLDTSVRAMFDSSSLATLAANIFRHQAFIAPPNLITTDSTKITPEMLPLIKLSQAEIDIIVAQVPGGIANIQDIYGLAPLQHGIMYHHMMSGEKSDPYLIVTRLIFEDRVTLDLYATALQRVVERHDVFRTSFIWRGLDEPAQVVWRHVPSILTEISTEDGGRPVREQLSSRLNSHNYRFDLTQAPLLRLIAAPTNDGGWVALQLFHHIICDHFTLERLNIEVHAIIDGSSNSLQTPTPFRHAVTRVRLEANPNEDKRYFSEMLADVDAPTLPFGLNDVSGADAVFNEAHLLLSQVLTDQLRAQARRLQISLASLCHLAWAQVLAQCSGLESVVFGTVLFGRFQAADGNDSAMGLLMNTLPLRLNIDDSTVEAAVRFVHNQLVELLNHEYASLAMAQRCSRLPSDVPLFSALLNYRQNQHDDGIATPLPGMTILNFEERTNYPLTLTIDDYNDSNELRLTVIVDSPLSPTRICSYVEQALTSLADALQHTPQQSVRTMTVLPTEERHLLLNTFNQTATAYPTDRCLHQLFEDQVTNNGNKIVQCEGETLSYAELNAQANRLAHYLVQLGVKPDSRVGLCMARTTALLVGILGILKSGGAYVPLDPAYPKQRLINILQDADPICIVTDSVGRDTLGIHQVLMVDMDQALPTNLSVDNLDITRLGLKSNHLAYVLYTSGSTGTPKGVMVEHGNATNLAYWAQNAFDSKDLEFTLFSTSVNFDISIFEYFAPLAFGNSIYIVPDAISLSGVPSTISMINTVPSAVTASLNANNLPSSLRAINLAGEPLSKRLIENIFAKTEISKLCNLYGPTETTIYSTYHKYEPGDVIVETIGKPVANTRIYLLNSQGEPVPFGAEGEMYIGGAGVARGYLNRPDLTAERFLADPFCDKPGARMYRTGDRARYLSNGNIIYLGRTDQQVKVRGYRIEPGEIEARLVNHPRVREAVVQPRSDGYDTRLIAYVVADPDELLARDLRTYLSSLLPSYMVPAAFVALSALPITPNGKLDRRALPVPDDTAFACQSYEAPKGENEEKLAVIWRELLGVDRISRHDNFFELGGHSLLVMQFVNHIFVRDMHIDPHCVFSFPILMDFAREMVQNFSKLYCDAAIPVRRTGNRMPVFVLPDGNGGISYGFELSHEIDNRYPIYALPWPSLENTQLLSMEELANGMIPLIKGIQPDGPCALVGYSAGGLLAYEIVKQLITLNYPVAFLGLLDTYVPKEERKRTKTDILLWSLAYEYPIFKTLNTSWYERVSKLSLDEAVEEIKNVNTGINHIDVERQAKLTIEQYHYQNICATYKIQPIPFKIHLYKAETWDVPCTGSEYLDNHMTNFYNNNCKYVYDHPSMCWGEFDYAKDLQVIVTKGDHFSIVRNPKDRTLLAEKLEQSINSCYCVNQSDKHL